MQWMNWLKPKTKIGNITTEKVKVSSNPLSVKLLEMTNSQPIDEMFKNTVTRRFLLTVHWQDIGSLFDALISERNNTPSLVAVNLYNYFKNAGSPPSICLQRLAYTLDAAQKVSHTVVNDIENLILQIETVGLFYRPIKKE